MKIIYYLSLFFFLAPGPGSSSKKQIPLTTCRATIANGVVEGNILPGGIHSFKGIPYAQPPVGQLRWKAPQPVKGWKGVLQAKQFSPRPMQNRIYSDMVFRSKTISEDCLYLNVWTPAKTGKEHLPVLVYFYGGGFMAGDGSEPRYDGESMARQGIVTLTVNYRLGVFGFLALPELTGESPYHSSGNYGLLDQREALRWVKKNIAAFGGDPAKVTIAGQSAGSMSVSAQMASPLSRGLFARAIGESGSVLGNLTPPTLAEREQQGIKFMALAGAKNLAALRKMPAAKLLEISAEPGAPHFGPVVDGYFLPKPPMEIYATGLQANVPLLAGWNSAEINYHGILGRQELTRENYRKSIEKLYGNRAGEVLRLYPDSTKEEIIKSATDLASDRFIAYSTWKWIDLHSKTDGKPVYRYRYDHLLPSLKNSSANNIKATGAPHSAEIPYALGNLPLIKAYAWAPGDFKVSAILQGFFANFIKTGNPNGPGLPTWPWLQSSIPRVMVIDTNSRAEPEKNQQRYQFLDQFYYK